jgi:hypothetical protein
MDIVKLKRIYLFLSHECQNHLFECQENQRKWQQNGVYCDVLSKDGASHMNARATSSNDRTVKENGGGAVVYIILCPSIY